MSKNTKIKFYNCGRFILEFRYDPIVSFYDWKGSLSEHLIEALGFTGFKIQEDRIDLAYVKKSDFVLFVSRQNSGLIIEDMADLQTVQNKISEAFDSLKAFEKFKPKNVVRIGPRWHLLRRKRGVSFLDLRKKFEDTIFNGEENPYTKLNENVDDVRLQINYKTEEFNCNIQHGPMLRAQAETQYFNNPDVYVDNNKIPNEGLFADIDVFKTKIGDLTLDEVKQTGLGFAKAGYDKFQDLSNGYYGKDE